MPPIRSRRPLAPSAVLGLLAWAGSARAQAPPAQANPIPNSSSKTVFITPNPQAAGNAIITLKHFEHAWWEDPTTNSGVAVNTPGQAAGFTGFGFEAVLNPAARGGPSGANNAPVLPGKDGKYPAGTTPVPVSYAMQNVVPGNANQPFVFTQVAGPVPPFANHALAQTNYTVGVVAKNVLPIEMAVNNSVDKTAPFVTYAFAYAGVTYTNSIAALKNLRLTTNYAATAGRVGTGIPDRTQTWDPISFTVHDASGNSLLFNQPLTVNIGTIHDGGLVWDPAGLHFTVSTTDGEVDLAVHVDGTYLLDATTMSALPTSSDLDLDILNGRVITSVNTGIFSGLILPGLGTMLPAMNGQATLDVSNLPAFDWLLNVPDMAGATDFELDMDTANLEFVPEPSAVALLALGGALFAGHRLARRRAST